MCRTPLAESNAVEITSTGRFDLCLEAPALTFFPGRGLEYELIRARDQETIELHYTPTSLMGRKAVSSVSFVVRAFQIDEAGKYYLKVSGFQPQTNYAAYALTISRPVTLKIFFYVLALVLTTLLCIGAIILTVGTSRQIH